MAPPAPAEPQRPRGHERPLRAVALVLLLVGAGLAAAYAVSERVDPVYGGKRVRWSRFMSRASEVEAITLGNSHNGALDFEALGVRGWRGHSPGGDYYEALYLLRSARPKLADLDYVFLAVSPFVFNNDVGADRAGRRRETHVMTGNYRPIAGDWRVAFQALLAPVIRTDNWEGVARRLTARAGWGPEPRPRAPRAQPNGGRETRRATVNPRLAARMTPEALEWYTTAVRLNAQGLEYPAMTPAALDWHASLAGPGHLGIEERGRRYDPNLCTNVRRALRVLAEVAAPARLVLYTPPYAPGYRRLSNSSACQLNRFAVELTATSPNVSYFDDRALEGFTNESGYFKNSDHVNERGARVYSAVLAERLGLRRPPQAVRATERTPLP